MKIGEKGLKISIFDDLPRKVPSYDLFKTSQVRSSGYSDPIAKRKTGAQTFCTSHYTTNTLFSLRDFEKMGSWKNEKIRKWENGKMGKWENWKRGKWENGRFFLLKMGNQNDLKCENKTRKPEKIMRKNENLRKMIKLCEKTVF